MSQETNQTSDLRNMAGNRSDFGDFPPLSLRKDDGSDTQIEAGPPPVFQPIKEGEIKQAVPQSRLTVVEMVYHQGTCGMSPVSMEIRFHELLKSTEDPYVRRFTVGNEWKQLEAGWLEEGDCSQLILKNEGPGTILVGLSLDRVLSVIPPKQSERLRPWRVSNRFVKCEGGEARITVVVIPK